MAIAAMVSRRAVEPEPAQSMGSNLAWMTAGTVWSGFCQWALLVVIAKLGSVDMLGAFTLALAIALPILLFSCLNLRSIYVTDTASAFCFRDYLGLRLLMSAISVALAAVLGLIQGYNTNLLLVIVLITLARAIDYVSDILYGVLQRRERMTAISVSLILRGTIGLIALGATLYTTRSLGWGAASLMLSSLVVLVLFDVPVSLRLMRLDAASAVRECLNYTRDLLTGSHGAAERLLSLAIAGAPLGVVVMLVSLNLNIPRYFVELNLGIREQGIYSSLANLMAAGSVVISALGQCVTPRLARHFSDRDTRAFGRLLWVLVLVSLALGAIGLAVAAVFGREVLAAVYRPEFAARQDVFVWLMAASGAVYLGSTMGVAITAARCFAPQMPLFAVSALTTAIACFWLVPSMGLRGAAIAIFVSAVIQSAGGVWLLRKAWRPAETLAARA